MRIVAALAMAIAVSPADAQPVPEGIRRMGTAADTVCGRQAADVPALLRQIASELANELGNERFTSFHDRANIRTWTFTKPAHPAHPTVTCRTVFRRDGAWYSQREISCYSTREACDRLYREFEELDAQLRRSMGGQ